MTKINNHLLPRMLIRNWEEIGAHLFIKESEEYRRIDENDFSSKYYYSLGKVDDELETRISKFETRLGHVLKKIKDASLSVFLTGKEIELLKLFCYLSACRQHNTSTVIQSDESEIYRNNNYLFGTPLVKTQEEAVLLTEEIIKEFERIQTLPDDAIFDNWSESIIPKTNNSSLCQGMHVSIIKSEGNNILVSDICAIIECTMDSDYLFTYAPISPKIALLLVKSKYYQDKKSFECTKKRLGSKYGMGNADPYISEIFCEDESVLFNSCYMQDLNVTVIPSTIEVKSYKNVYVKIRNCDEISIQRLNSIMFEDGNKVVVCNKKDLDRAKSKLMIRKVIVE